MSRLLPLLYRVTGWLAFTAVLVHGYRLSHWRAFATTSNPLLFVLNAARFTVMAYWALMLAVLSWVLGPVSGADPVLMMDISALGWMLAFAIFIWIYWPILTRARP